MVYYEEFSELTEEEMEWLQTAVEQAERDRQQQREEDYDS